MTVFPYQHQQIVVHTDVILAGTSISEFSGGRLSWRLPKTQCSVSYTRWIHHFTWLISPLQGLIVMNCFVVTSRADSDDEAEYGSNTHNRTLAVKLVPDQTTHGIVWVFFAIYIQRRGNLVIVVNIPKNQLWSRWAMMTTISGFISKSMAQLRKLWLCAVEWVIFMLTWKHCIGTIKSSSSPGAKPRRLAAGLNFQFQFSELGNDWTQDSCWYHIHRYR